MYHAIVRRTVRGLWAEINSTRSGAPAVKMAADTVDFRFLGDTPISATLTTREEFAVWFTRVFRLMPNLQFTPELVMVSGWPWNTTVNVRLAITGTLADGSAYRNTASQWVTLRWGKMTRDIVLEDTALLIRACAIQEKALRQ